MNKEGIVLTELPKGYHVLNRHYYVREPDIVIVCSDFSKAGRAIEFYNVIFDEKLYKWYGAASSEGHYAFAMEFRFVEDLKAKRLEEEETNLWINLIQTIHSVEHLDPHIGINILKKKYSLTKK